MISNFPVDDMTLDAIEHALGGSLTVNANGDPVLVGAEYTFNQLLDFLAGHDTSQDRILDDDGSGVITIVNETPSYHYSDCIRALITEIRALRAAAHWGST